MLSQALRARLRSVLSLRDALADISQRHLAKACCELSRRDGAIVAWHEVPGTAPPQRSRPGGYGMIRAGVRTDSTGYDRYCLYGTRWQTFRNSI